MSLTGSIKRGVAGVASGCLAFVAGYLFAFVLTSGRVERFLSSAGTGVDFTQVIAQYGERAAPGTAKVVAWFYLGAHDVALEMQAQAMLMGSESVVVSVTDSPVWTDLLWLVPPAALVGIGFLFVRGYTEGTGRSALGGAVALTVGYAGLALVAAGLSIWQFDVGVGAIALIPRVSDLVMLGVYPAIFGGAGCALGTLGDDSEAAPSHPPVG